MGTDSPESLALRPMPIGEPSRAIQIPGLLVLPQSVTLSHPRTGSTTWPRRAGSSAMPQEIKQIGSFEAVDADGSKVQLVCLQSFYAGIGGRKSMRTAEGQAVNDLGGGRYQIDGDNRELYSDYGLDQVKT